MIPRDPASVSAVLALEDDPFYQSITADFSQDCARRRAALADYFSLSINEGERIGRSVHLDDPSLGVAVWHIPQPPHVEAAAAERKRLALERILGPEGVQNYHRIVDCMSARAEEVVPPQAWYLSIVAIDPNKQGQGFGQRLLAPTLAEADEKRVVCFLETFSARNPAFYGRLGFRERARFNEPTTGAEYVVMIRG